MKKTFLMSSLFLLLASSTWASPAGDWEFKVDGGVQTLIGYLDLSLSFDGSIAANGSYTFGEIEGYIVPLGSVNGCFGSAGGTGTISGEDYIFDDSTLYTYIDASSGIDITLACSRLILTDPQTLEGKMNIIALMPLYGADVEFSGTRVPIPAGLWLLFTGMVGLAGIKKNRRYPPALFNKT